MYRSILIPTDGSNTSAKAIEQGLGLAKLSGGSVTFLHVLENPLTAGYATPESMPYAAQLYEDLKTSGANILAEAVAEARAAGVNAESKLVEEADPVNAISEESE